MSTEESLDQDFITRELAHLDTLQLRFEPTVDSTNTWVLDEARHIPAGTVLFAEEQVAGRGRRGRQWHSPQAKNVYGTLAWSWSQPLERLAGLSSAVGVGLVEALDDLGVPGLALKWPNDVYANGRKIAGILIESSAYAGEATRLAIGVGVNVHMQDTEPDARAISQPWTSVSEAMGRPVSRNRVAVHLARALHGTLQRFADGGWAAFASGWRKHDFLYGRLVETTGTPALKGIAAGVDACGALLVDVEGVLHPVHAGEVSVRPATSGT